MSKSKDFHSDFFYKAWKLQKSDEVRNPLHCEEMEVSDIDNYIVNLFGIRKPNIQENFVLVSSTVDKQIFETSFPIALSKFNCVSGSDRIRAIYKNDNRIINIVSPNVHIAQQLICSVPFVENTELFYKEIFKGKENATNVQS